MKSSGNHSLTIMKPQGKMNYKAGHVIKHMFRSSHPKAFYRKGALKIFAKFTGKHLCWNLFFRRLQHRCFPVNFVNFLRTSSFTVHFRWLLLTCYGNYTYLPLKYQSSPEFMSTPKFFTIRANILQLKSTVFINIKTHQRPF